MNNSDLIAVFLHHVASSPDKLAIMTTDTSFTYQQLFVEVVRWKELFCQHLQSQDRVVVQLERTPRLLSVLLALQWLEITYIPVNLATPIERLRTIINDSQAHALLYDSSNHLDYAPLSCLTMNLAYIVRPLQNEVTAPTDVHLPKQKTLAYIIYTSGSTGTPKGVAISRDALNHFLTSMSHYFLKKNNELLLAITTIGFDIAALELYLPIWQQKTVFLANDQQHKDPSQISKLLNDYPITLLQATPAMWSILKDMEWGNQSKLIALCGGEPLPPSLADRLLAKTAELWNMYGPTEATIWCALKQITPHETITIGRPIDNMEMMVMDSSLHKLPPYAKGELFIGGRGLAEGYINNDTLTQSQFINYPGVLGGRLYRVGDIACTTSNGEFILFGRVDNQIKLHGYRIELEEVEAQIQTISAVQKCAVVVNHEHLIAYICLITPDSLSETELLKHLTQYLPEYMLPKRIIFLEKLPLTSSGKIDRNALSRLTRLKTTTPTELVEPSPLQSLVTRIWSEEFRLSTIGSNDNFFELGGHSLLAERILLKIRRETKKQITLDDFYRHPSIMQLTTVIEQTHPKEQKQTQPLLLKNDHWQPLNDFQLMFWISAIFEPSLKALRIVSRKRIQGNLNKEALDAALLLVLQKQDALSYAINPFYPAQKQLKNSSAKWIEKSYVDCDDEMVETLLNTSFDELNAPPQSPLKAPPLIAKLIYLKNNQIELQISMSHFIADIASVELFFGDLSNAYLYYTQQSTLNTTQQVQSPISYAMHQKNVFEQYERIDATFWKTYLRDAGLFSFPKKYIIENTIKKSFQFSTYIEISELLLTKLRTFCTNNHVTINNALCAGVALALKSCCKNGHSNTPKLIINSVKSTRDEPYFDNTIGCFLTNHLTKLDLNGNISLTGLAKQAQLSSLETAEHQRAAALIKLASIGHLPPRRGFLKQAVISMIILIFSKISHKMNISATVLTACEKLSATDRQKDFFINVNILSNFVSDNARPLKQNLLGNPCKNIPLHPYNLSTVEHVFDVTFIRHSIENTPFLVVSSNLTPKFRQGFGQKFLDVLQELDLEQSPNKKQSHTNQ